MINLLSQLIRKFNFMSLLCYYRLKGLILLWLLNTMTLSAQSLFTLNSRVHHLLTTTEATRLTTLRLDSRVTSVQFITVGSLRDLQNHGTIAFTLPQAPNETLHATGRYIEDLGEGDYAWWGEVAASGDSIGDGGILSYIQKDGARFGHLEARNQTHEFFDLGATQVLVTYDTATLHLATCEVGEDILIEPQNQYPNTASEPLASSLVSTSSQTQPCEVITLLVLYSDNALAHCLSLRQTASMAVWYMNSAIKNSRIHETQIRIVGVENLSSFTESNDIARDAETYGDLAETQRLRDSLRADLVLLLAHDDDYANTGSVEAVNADSLSSYAISDIFYTSSTNNLAHEVGHLLGCHHLNNSNYSGPDRASTFSKWFKVYRTIVMNANRNRIPYYSNPNVKYLNKPTGRTDEFNAQQIFDIRCQASDVYPDPLDPLSGYISGLYEMLLLGNATFTATISGGKAPYTYEWRTSPDGFNWGPIEESANYFIFVPPYNAEGIYYIQLTVTDTNGKTITRIRGVDILPDHPLTFPIDELAPQLKSSKNHIFTSSISVFPNPFQETTELVFTLAKETDVKITVRNLLGQIMYQASPSLQAGPQHWPLHFSGSPGIYICHITAGETQVSIPLMQSFH